jgi:multisubunit Na+/H+ antiporter MnhB subunit
MVDFTDKTTDFVIGLIVLGILLFTVFFPTFNSSAGINNKSTIEIGGSTNAWFIPAFIAFVFIGALLIIIGLVKRKK